MDCISRRFAGRTGRTGRTDRSDSGGCIDGFVGRWRVRLINCAFDGERDKWRVADCIFAALLPAGVAVRGAIACSLDLVVGGHAGEGLVFSENCAVV